jgi:hypothetical protein
MSLRILRVVTITSLLLGLASVFLPLAIAAQNTAPARLDDPDLQQLYPIAQKVQVMGELCLQQAPDHAAGVSAALATWNTRHARPQLDSLINATARRRAAIGRSLIRSMGATLFGGDIRAACSNFAAHIGTAEHDLGVSNPDALRSARRKLGAPAYVETPSTVAATSGPVLTPPPADVNQPIQTVPPPVTRATGTTGATGATGATGTTGTTGTTATSSTARAAGSLADVPSPPGWARSQMNDGSLSFTISPNDTGYATIVVALPQPFSGQSVENALRGWLRSQLASRLDLSLKNTVSLGRTVRGQLAAWADETPDFHNSSNGLRLAAVAVARRDNTFIPVMMLTKDDAHQYNRVNQFRAWFSGIALPGDTGPRWTPLAPPPQPRGTAMLQGLWFGTQLRPQLNIYGGMDVIAARTYIAMYRNGFAYRELPGGGRVDEGNAAELCSEDPTDCGTYRVEPTRIVFDWNTTLGLVETDTAALELPRKEPPGFEFDGVPLYRISPVALTRLDGEFTSIDGTSSGPNGSISLARSITFHATGRYEATRAVGFTSTPGASTGTETGSVVGYNPNIGPNRGTYEIVGYTLTMRPENGPVRRSTIIFFDDERPVTSVLIDDNYYKK